MKKPHAYLQTDIKMCVKFQKDRPKTVRGVALTRKQGRNGYLKCSKGNNTKIGQARVTVLGLSMSTQSALHLCEVS